MKKFACEKNTAPTEVLRNITQIVWCILLSVNDPSRDVVF